MSVPALAGKDARRALDQRTSAPAREWDASPHVAALARVLYTYVPRADAVEQICELVKDHIFRYVLETAQSAIAPRIEDDENWTPAIQAALKMTTRLEPDAAKRFAQQLKQAVQAVHLAPPSTARRKRLREKFRRAHCHVCGVQFEDAEQGTLEHMWPVAAGGGVGNANTGVAHSRCNTLKGDAAMPADAHALRHAYADLPAAAVSLSPLVKGLYLRSENQFSSHHSMIREAQLRLAVLLRQDFCCAYCKELIADCGPVELVRINDAEPWWYPNVIATCRICTPKSSAVAADPEQDSIDSTEGQLT